MRHSATDRHDVRRRTIANPPSNSFLPGATNPQKLQFCGLGKPGRRRLETPQKSRSGTRRDEQKNRLDSDLCAVLVFWSPQSLLHITQRLLRSESPEMMEVMMRISKSV